MDSGFNITFAIDAFILFILVIAMIAGFVRGLLKELFSIGIWVLSALGAWMLSIPVGNYLANFMYDKWGEDKIARIFGDGTFDIFIRLIAGTIVLAALLLILQAIFSIFTNSFNGGILKSTDRVFGALFGGFKAIILFGIIWYIVDDQMGISKRNDLNAQQNYVVEFAENSKMLPFVKIGRNISRPFLDPFMNKVSEKVDDFSRSSNPDEAVEQAITPQIQNQNSIEPIAPSPSAAPPNELMNIINQSRNEPAF